MNCSTCTLNCKNNFEKFKDEYAEIDSFKYNPNIHSKPTSVLLSVTNRCNLQCSYCFVKQNNLDMTYEIADKSIQWVLSNNNSEEKITISFFGGEPLLKFNDIIIPIVEKYYEQVNFNITTNGLLLNEDIIDFFFKYDIQPLLSFDGVPEVQNKQRSNSFNTILKNIPYLLLRFPETTMRATLTQKSIPYLYETILMAEELGFKHIFFCENAYENWTIKDEEILRQQFNKLGLYIYKKLRNKENCIKIDPINRIFKSINLGQHNQLYFNNNIMRCGLGTTSCAITPNGDIIPCQEKTSNPTIILGNIFNGINYDIHKQYLINYFNQVNTLKCCNNNCSEKEKLICLSNLCPSRLEDLNYQISTASCILNKVATQVSLKLHFLCAYSNEQNIRDYFNQEDDDIWNQNQSE